MNSRILLLLLIVFVAACGVKGDPVAPKDANLPSLMENYPDITLPTPLGDNKKL